MTYLGTVTSKGQTTIPKEVRDQLKLRAGDEVYWTIVDGTAILRARTGSLLDIAGMFHNPTRKPLSDMELQDAIGDSMAARATAVTKTRK
ncbi:hypothetical protein BH10PSE7_BH10PSE7_24230 [soil metagenome]